MGNHNEFRCTKGHHKDAHGNHLPRPPYHPKIARNANNRHAARPLEPGTLGAYRKYPMFNENTHSLRVDDLAVVPFFRRVYKDDAAGPYVSYTVFMPKDPSVSGTWRPCIFYIHPGGPAAGNELCRIDQILKWVVELKLICVAVNYPLAPENIHPAAVLDCYYVLKDIAKHGDLLDQQISMDIDLGNICILAGEGGAAIAVSLAHGLEEMRRVPTLETIYIVEENISKVGHVPLAGGSSKRKLDDEMDHEDTAPTKKQKITEQGTSKDTPREFQNMKAVRKPLRIKGMLLYSPMLDYRLDSVSAAQFKKGSICDAEYSDVFWSLYLKGTYGGFRHDAYSQEGFNFLNPGSWDNLEGMPATFIEVGSCEAYRSEAIRFAEQMWRCGGDCELHVWAGGSSGFPHWYPKLQISKSAIKARRKWLERTLCGVD